jgi:hypothetical protein
MDIDLKHLLYEIVSKSPENLFDRFLEECNTFYTKPAHTLTELRNRVNKKVRGDLFEEFCVLYLKYVRGYQDVWRLEDVPEETLTKLSMKRKDMGIDLIVSAPEGFYAVQCKYKKSESRKTCISWSALSTFYALCLRTGPWQKYIVMTTADSTRRQGPKTEKDLSLCLGTFRGLKREDWLKMSKKSDGIHPVDMPKNSLEELRAKRLAYFTGAAYFTAQNAPPQSELPAP